MAQTSDERTDPSGGKTDASPSGPGSRRADSASISRELHERISAKAYALASQREFAPGGELKDWLDAERELEFGTPRNTPPDNPNGEVKTQSNE